MKEDIMLEKIMNLHVLLYSMAGLGALGAMGMLATHLTYRRMIRSTGKMTNLKEKWLSLWKTRDRLLHRMNRLVWYPALISTGLLGVSFYFTTVLKIEEGLPLVYLYPLGFHQHYFSEFLLLYLIHLLHCSRYFRIRSS